MTLLETLNLIPNSLSSRGEFFFIDKYIYASNNITTVRVKNPSDITDITVRASDLMQSLKRMSDPKVVRKENSLVVSSGRAKATLVSIKSLFQPVMFRDVSLIDLPASFYTGLGHCMMMGNRSPYSGVYVDEKHMLATDGQYSVCYSLDTPLDTFYIGDTAVKALAEQAYTRIHIGGEYITFDHPDIRLAVRRLREGAFPYKRLMEFKAQWEAVPVRAMPVGFSEAVKRASAMGTEDGMCKLTLIFKTDGVTVIGDKRSGTYEEMIVGVFREAKFTGKYSHLVRISDGDFVGVRDFMTVRKQDCLIGILGIKED